MFNTSRIVFLFLLITFIGHSKGLTKDSYNIKELGIEFHKSDIKNKYKSAMLLSHALDTYVHNGISVSIADLFKYLGVADMYINYSSNQSQYGYIFNVIHENKITEWVLYFSFKNSKLVLVGDNALKINDHSSWVKVKKNQQK